MNLMSLIELRKLPVPPQEPKLPYSSKVLRYAKQLEKQAHEEKENKRFSIIEKIVARDRDSLNLARESANSIIRNWNPDRKFWVIDPYEQPQLYYAIHDDDIYYAAVPYTSTHRYLDRAHFLSGGDPKAAIKLTVEDLDVLVDIAIELKELVAKIDAEAEQAAPKKAPRKKAVAKKPAAKKTAAKKPASKND